ncbi:MAG: hypothetical protein ACNA8W_16535, partial [Bradymonadaceae bacterium]
MSETKVPAILCQPGGGKSCGACCGLYNHRRSSRDETMARLERRTRAYHESCDIHDEDSLVRFRQAWEPAESGKLLTGLPNCPFLGLLKDDGRVGCLVHPR